MRISDWSSDVCSSDLAVSLDIPPITFIQRLREVVPITDLYVGLVKAPVFGMIIAVSGCFQGMQVEGNAEEVGLRTTAAVVQAIFLVIVLDSFFAVFFTWIGWVCRKKNRSLSPRHGSHRRSEERRVGEEGGG